MNALTFPQYCNIIVFESFKHLYNIKRGDKLQTKKNVILIECQRIISDDNTIMFSANLYNRTREIYREISNIKGIHHKTVDNHLEMLLVDIGDVLASNNKLFPECHIHNNIGRISDHYTWSR